MNFYPRYPSDYISKTMHLTMEQDGAYTRLLDWCYANEKPIPHEQRYAIARAQSRRERASVDAVLEQFFDKISTESRHDSDTKSCSKGAWKNARVLREIDKDEPRRAAARVNGRKGGRPKKPPEDPNPSGFEEKPTGFLGYPSERHNPKSSPDPYPNKQEANAVARTGLEAKRKDAPARPPDRVLAAKAMIDAGVVDAHGGYAPLVEYLAAGGSVACLADVAAFAVSQDRPRMAYVVATARGQLADAQRATRRGSRPNRQQTIEHRNRQAASVWAAQSEPKENAHATV